MISRIESTNFHMPNALYKSIADACKSEDGTLLKFLVRHVHTDLHNIYEYGMVDFNQALSSLQSKGVIEAFSVKNPSLTRSQNQGFGGTLYRQTEAYRDYIIPDWQKPIRKLASEAYQGLKKALQDDFPLI